MSADDGLHPFREMTSYDGRTRDFCWESLVLGRLDDGSPISQYCGRSRAEHPAPGELRWPPGADQIRGKALGQVAYEGYLVAVGGLSLITGDLLPDWADLLPEVREGWRAAADAVAMWIRR